MLHPPADRWSGAVRHGPCVFADAEALHKAPEGNHDQLVQVCREWPHLGHCCRIRGCGADGSRRRLGLELSLPAGSSWTCALGEVGGLSCACCSTPACRSGWACVRMDRYACGACIPLYAASLTTVAYRTPECVWCVRLMAWRVLSASFAAVLALSSISLQYSLSLTLSMSPRGFSNTS